MALTRFVPAQTKSIDMKRQNEVDSTNMQSTQSRAYDILKPAWELAHLFGKRSTIHGVNRILGETEGRYERIIWFLTVVLAFAGSIYACLVLSRRFRAGKFETVVDNTRYPVYKIYFPVITICNLNHLNWARIEEAKERFLPNETSSEKLQLFEQILGTYDDLEFAKFHKFDVLKDKPLESLNHINFSQVVDFMTWRCDEFIEKCIWRHKKKNCCTIFSMRRSKNGLCWSFNTLETDEGRNMQRLDPMWPWRNGGAGTASGLNVRLLINPDKHYPKNNKEKGISVMIAEPNVWHSDPFYVEENTEALFQIEPVVFFHDNNTRSISSKQRKCVFDDERTSSDFKSLQNYIYMIENCQAECQQKYLMKYCNCSMDLFFPPGQYPACKIKDLLCLARNNDNFQHTFQPREKEILKNVPKGMECQCLLNCYSLIYKTYVRTSFLPPEERKNVSYVDLDVHFRFFALTVYRTTMVFTWMDLMVAFGGIVGLFLGCSLISALELIYFACIEMPNFWIERIRYNRIQHSQLQDTNANFMKRSVKQKFNDLMLQSGAKNESQLEKGESKNNKTEAALARTIYKDLQTGHLVNWQRLKNNTHNDGIFYA